MDEQQSSETTPRYRNAREQRFRGPGAEDASTLAIMSPIPGEPLKPKAPELTTSDGRKFKLKVPDLAPPPGVTEERGRPEAPREDPDPPVNPDHAGF